MMAKRRKTPKLMLSLEDQLREHDLDAPKERGHTYDQTYRREHAKRRAEILDAIRRRDAKKLNDPGRTAGNFGPSPYAQRGNVIEMAPKNLGEELPKDSQFPKRIATQRVIDRLKARGTIDHDQWVAADMLWRCWHQAITGDRLTAAYESITVHTSPDTGRLVAKRMDAAMQYLGLMGLVPYRCRGVVTHVVINDWELSCWGRERGFDSRHSRRLGAERLSQGLRALAAQLRS